MKKLNAQEILDKLQDFPNWNFLNNGIEKHFKFNDFEILNYNPHPHIKGKVAV